MGTGTSGFSQRWHQHSTWIGAAFFAFAAVLAVFASTASAQLAHPTVSHQFGPDGTSGTHFSWPLGGIAYQTANKRVYVEGEEEIHGFSNPSAGTYTPLGSPLPLSVGYSAYPLAVDNSTGPSANNVYHVNSDAYEIDGYNESFGTLSGWPVNDNFHEICGLAVDNGGNVWAGERSNGLAEWAASGGSPSRHITSLGNVCGVAFDQTNNDLYAASTESSNVYRLSAASGYTEKTTFAIGTSSGYQIAVDGQHHVLFVAWQGTMEAFDTQTGRLLEKVTGIAGNIYGITVDEATDAVFISSTYNPEGVEVLEAVEVPAPITEAPTANHEVSGTADPDGAGEITECFFEFGTTTSYGSSEECAESTPISSPETVHATLPGLLGETAYHYRLVLKNANGAAYGADETITPHNVMGVNTGQATDVTRTTAQLNGAFEGTGEDTTYYFEYATNAEYEPHSEYSQRWPQAPDEEDAGATTGSTPMSVVVTGLEPETTYHFRVVAENAKGKNLGEDETLTTPKAVADLLTENASDETKHSAVLHGSFTGTGEPHTYFFEWGPTDNYGNSTPIESAGSGTGTVHVATEIENLDIYLPDSLPLHYRVVATNSTGTTIGPDHTFQTLPPDVPEIASSGVSGVSLEAATVGASINPGGGETVFLVEYGPTEAYGSETVLSESIGEDETAHSVTAQLDALTPGTTYHYQVVAFNFAGTARSVDGTFTTSSPPPPSSPVPAVTTPGTTTTPAPTKPKPKRCKAGQVKRGGKCVKKPKHHHKKHKKSKKQKGRHGNG